MRTPSDLGLVAVATYDALVLAEYGVIKSFVIYNHKSID